MGRVGMRSGIICDATKNVCHDWSRYRAVQLCAMRKKTTLCNVDISVEVSRDASALPMDLMAVDEYNEWWWEE